MHFVNRKISSLITDLIFFVNRVIIKCDLRDYNYNHDNFKKKVIFVIEIVVTDYFFLNLCQKFLTKSENWFRYANIQIYAF